MARPDFEQSLGNTEINAPQPFSRRRFLEMGGAVAVTPILSSILPNVYEETISTATSSPHETALPVSNQPFQSEFTLQQATEVDIVPQLTQRVFVKEGIEESSLSALKFQEQLEKFWGGHYKNTQEGILLEAAGILEESFSLDQLQKWGYQQHPSGEGRGLFGDAPPSYRARINTIIRELLKLGVPVEKVLGRFVVADASPSDQNPNQFFVNVVSDKVVFGIGYGGDIQEKRTTDMLITGIDQQDAQNTRAYTFTKSQRERMIREGVMEDDGVSFGPSLFILEKSGYITMDGVNTPDKTGHTIVPPALDALGKEITDAPSEGGVRIARKWGPHNITEEHWNYIMEVSGGDERIALRMFGYPMSEPIRVQKPNGSYVVFTPYERCGVSTDNAIADPEWQTQRSLIGNQYLRVRYGTDRMPNFPSTEPGGNPETRSLKELDGEKFKDRIAFGGNGWLFTAHPDVSIAVVPKNVNALDEIGRIIGSGKRIQLHLVRDREDAAVLFGTDNEWNTYSVQRVPDNRPIDVGEIWGRDVTIKGDSAIIILREKWVLELVNSWSRLKNNMLGQAFTPSVLGTVEANIELHRKVAKILNDNTTLRFKE